MTRRRITQWFAGAVLAAALLLAVSAKGQTVKLNEVVKWDDYTFKFGPSAQMAQVLQGDKVVGTILMMNGSMQVQRHEAVAIVIGNCFLAKDYLRWSAYSAAAFSS